MIFFDRFGTRFGIVQKDLVDESTYLFPSEKKELDKIAHPSRQIEFKGIRQLRNVLAKDHRIYYNENGKPFLIDSDHSISVSHSDQSICLGLAASNFGVDIETPQQRILKISSKFCSEEETKLFDQTSIIDMTLLWTIKEAVYKTSDERGLDFKKSIRVFKSDKNNHSCLVTKKNGISEIRLRHEFFEGQILTYTSK